MPTRTLDRQFGKRVYDWLGQHPRFYRGIRWTVCFGRERFLQRTAMQAVGLKAGDTVLDLACGAGSNLAFLREMVGPEGSILAVDYSTGMLEQAKAIANQRGWSNIQFMEADAAELSLPKWSLDGAVCTFALSAMPGEQEAIRNVASALKPGARFVVLDAKAFTGWAAHLNPLVGPIFKYTTAWSYEKDVPPLLRRYFGEVDIREFHSGCNYVAVATTARQ